mmetsp:Transcript_39558/g.45062  ORF Transcript_39558/g.45062 Transcript_39558/m.45062 type:complete len:654 (-) Transcript_39558:117-2078(-)
MNLKLLALNSIVLFSSKALGFAPVRTSIQRCNDGYSSQDVGFHTSVHPQVTKASPTQLRASILDTNEILNLLLAKTIDSGVPAIFTLILIFYAGKTFADNKNREKMMPIGRKSAASELYDDLYGGFENGPKPRFSFPGFGGPPPRAGPPNLGTPSAQFIKLKSLNEKYDSYDYNVVAATENKALAAAKMRSKNFDRALKKATFGSTELHASEKAELLKVEKQFLGVGSKLMDAIVQAEAQLTDFAICEQMDKLGVSIEDIDLPLNVTKNVTAKADDTKKKDGKNKQDLEKVKKALEESVAENQKSLLNQEISFLQNVTQILGAERANSFRAATLGDVATRGSGQIIRQLQDRPLSVMLGEEGTREKSVYVMRFPGDTTASQVEALREEVTAIVRSAKAGDEALMVLESGGGTVTGYGLAAGQLLRFKEAGIKLTVCVEQVAASGGYMMCCTADRIVASPLAVLGSIGVITEIPNFFERLTTEGIEFSTITAGKYKRTLTPTKKITKEDIQKQKEDIEKIFNLFKSFVASQRPSLVIDDVATGDVWFGQDAVKQNLCDEIKTADSVLTEYVDKGYNVYDIKYSVPETDPLKQALQSIPGSNYDSSNEGLFRGAMRWVVKTVMSEVRNEISSTMTPPIQETYMAKDESADQFKFR